MVRDTPSFQDASTHQIWNSYLKEYRRNGPDTKRDRRTDGRTDGQTDSAITICLPKFLWGHKNKVTDVCKVRVEELLREAILILADLNH